MEALFLWRRFPGEIASDLSQFHRRRIADWHQGSMDSYEFLELCEYMPDQGRFKAALRQHYPGHEWLFAPWSEPAHALYQTANETAIVRAARVPQAKSEDMGSTLFIPPDKLIELAQEKAETDSARESVFAMADRPGDDEGD